MTDLLETNRIK